MGIRLLMISAIGPTSPPNAKLNNRAQVRTAAKNTSKVILQDNETKSMLQVFNQHGNNWPRESTTLKLRATI